MGGMGGARRHRRTEAPGEDQLYRMEVDFRDTVLGGEKEITLPSGRRLAVRIPPGIADGTRLRFAGQGGPGSGGGPSGDAYVEIRVRPDERFRVQGEDLMLELPVPIETAVLGGEVRAPTVDGEVALPPLGKTRICRAAVGGHGGLPEEAIRKMLAPPDGLAQGFNAVDHGRQRVPQPRRSRSRGARWRPLARGVGAATLAVP